MKVDALGAWRIKINLSNTLTTAKIAALAIERKIQSMAAPTMAPCRTYVNKGGISRFKSGER